MALNPSGIMSIGGSSVGSSINLELGLSATANSNLNQPNFRTLAGVPAGFISLSNFYGKSNIIPAGYSIGGPSALPNGVSTSRLKIVFGTMTGSVLSAWPSPLGRGQYGSSFTDLGMILATPATPIAVFNKQSFSTDAISTASSPFPIARSDFCRGLVTGNTSYIYGGPNASPSLCLFMKYNKTADTMTALSFPFSPTTGGLSQWAQGFNALANHNRGYVTSGQGPVNPNGNSFKYLDYASEAFTSYLNNIWPGCSAERNGVFNSTTIGYTLTGLGSTPLGYPTQMSGLVFSTNSGSRTYQGIGFQKFYSWGVYEPTFGLSTGGSTSAPTTKYTFSTATISDQGTLGLPNIWNGGTLQSTPTAAN